MAIRQNTLLFIPGGGFASVGLGVLATGSYLFAVVELVLLIVAGYWPGRGLMLFVTAMLCASLVMVTVERVWVRVKRARGANGGGVGVGVGHWMLRYGLAVTMLPWVLGTLAVWVWVSGFAFLVVRGGGMEPSVGDGAVVLVRMYEGGGVGGGESAAMDGGGVNSGSVGNGVGGIERGDVLLVRLPNGAAVGAAGELVVVRVAGLGGDVITREGDWLVIEGGGRYRAVGSGRRWAEGISIGLEGTAVPVGSLFVMQDDAEAGIEGREIGWVGAGDVMGDRLYRLGWERLFEVVE